MIASAPKHISHLTIKSDFRYQSQHASLPGRWFTYVVVVTLHQHIHVTKLSVPHLHGHLIGATEMRCVWFMCLLNDYESKYIPLTAKQQLLRFVTLAEHSLSQKYIQHEPINVLDICRVANLLSVCGRLLIYACIFVCVFCQISIHFSTVVAVKVFF